MTRFAAAALAASLAAAAAQAAPQTVCTITVNSADEREVFRQYLPAERYRFEELADVVANAPGPENNRRDWLGAACRRGVTCDILVVSGHFAGTDFYSSRHGEHLPVDEMERVACSDSCPGLFSQLKEVYLFGCDTLKPEPVRSATPEIVRALLAAGHSRSDADVAARELSRRHGESARDRMRRIFAGVPVIYGFSSLAPYGRVAGPMLRGYFEAGGADEVGRGEPSARLLRLFGPASMVATPGQRSGDHDAAFRAEACRYHDERISRGERLAFVGEILAGERTQLRMNFDRIERLLGDSLAGIASLVEDSAARANYLGVTRSTADPALRVRMVTLARRIGWLDETGERAELATMIGEMLAAGSAGYSEVGLVCELARDRAFESELARFDVARLARSPANAAALACMGSAPSRLRVLRALASPDEAEVQVAQAFLRHRPIEEATELRELVREIARMKAAPAQARALEAVARQPVGDEEAFGELTRLFERTRSLAVQRAIAEIFLRRGPPSEAAVPIARLLREKRIKSPDGRDLIDLLIERLGAA